MIGGTFDSTIFQNAERTMLYVDDVNLNTIIDNTWNQFPKVMNQKLGIGDAFTFA